MFGHRWIASTVFSLCIVGARLSAAQPAPPVGDSDDTLQWADDWPRFRLWEGLATIAGLGGSVILQVVVGSPEHPHWTGGILFDDAYRNWVVADTRDGRVRANQISDIFYFGSIGYSLVIDTLLVTWAIRGSPDVAGQMFLMDAESFGLAGFVALLTQKTIGRQRPFGRGCAQDPDYDPDCGTAEENVSFISGHTAVAFTGAGLICVHHQYLALYGGVWDGVACGLGIALATLTATTRTIADSHYFSDVVLGVAVGGLFGYLLPRWLHYGWGDEPREDSGASPQLVLVPAAIDDALGVRILGFF